jgi:hypothetical protein
MADQDERQSVTVAFGRGLNTAQQGNVVNHVMLPNDVEINQGGVAHFLVAGFHQPSVYKPGTKPEDIVVPTTGTSINDPNNRFYLGIPPAGGPPPSTAPTPTPADTRSNAQNRAESVGFPFEPSVPREGVKGQGPQFHADVSAYRVGPQTTHETHAQWVQARRHHLPGANGRSPE